VTASSMWR